MLHASTDYPTECLNWNLTTIYLIPDELQEDKECNRQKDVGEEQITGPQFKKNDSNPYPKPIYSYFINNPTRHTQTPSPSSADFKKQPIRRRRWASRSDRPKKG